MRCEGTESRILFVDDEEGARKAFRRSMMRQGFDVDLAASPDDALRLARARSYPVVVSDVRMPGLDGFALIERLRSVLPLTSFILLTGLPSLDKRQIENDVESHIVSVVAKPWDDHETATLIARALELHDHRQASALAGSRRWVGDTRILIVEDNCVDVERLTRLLERLGHQPEQIHVASMLQEAVALLHDERFDVVLTDLSLPDAWGIDAVRRLQNVAGDTAILVFSGNGDDALALQTLRFGAQDFVPKSHLDADTLERSMRHAIERKRAEQRLSQLAHFDQLTGLANRSTLQTRITRALSRAARSGTSLGVLFVDVDHFKSVNDTYGHDVGDALLQAVSQRLLGVVREYDTVARWGGDEFALLVEEVDDAAFVHKVAARLLETFTHRFPILDLELSVSVSVGVAISPRDGRDARTLLKAADKAMYRAKAQGRNCSMDYASVSSHAA